MEKVRIGMCIKTFLPLLFKWVTKLINGRWCNQDLIYGATSLIIYTSSWAFVTYFLLQSLVLNLSSFIEY